jgi:alkylhydroperoxidase/carboxymuconolactone decarboxylase family protein YurZ
MPTDQLQGLAGGDLSVLDTLLRMHEGTLEASGLDPQTYALVRVAALATEDAAPLSWLTHITLSGDVGVSPEQIVGTLIAIAPMIGTVRIITAARGILGAMGLADQLAADTKKK